MHPRIILAIARKDMLDVLRNRGTLMALLTPLFVAGLYWLLSIGLSQSTTTLALYDPGHSALVTTDTLPSNTKWIILAAPSADAVRTMVDNNEQNTAVGVVLPPNTDATLRAGGRPAVQIYFHAAKESSFQRQLFVAGLIAASQQIAQQQPPIQVTATLLRQPPDQPAGDASNTDFMQQLNSALGVITLLIGLLSAGMLLLPSLLVEEKEKKTLRMVLASPASYGDVIAGKLLVGFAYTMILSVVLLLISRIPTEALPEVLVFVILGALFFLLTGLALAAVSKTMTEVNTYGSVIFLLAMIPMMLNMPGLDLISGSIGGLARIIPNYWMVDGMRRAVEGTANAENFLLNAGVTAAMIVALFLLTTWLLRRQQLSAA